MKQLQAEVLKTAFEHLRRCGAGQRECVVYLTSTVDQPDLLDGVIHPRHSSGPAGYDLDSAAVAALWSDLAAGQRSVQVQIHTHPGVAFHSSRDDALAIVHSTGFLSLVIPDFALGAVGFEGAYLAERTGDGRWASVPISERLAIAP